MLILSTIAVNGAADRGLTWGAQHIGHLTRVDVLRAVSWSKSLRRETPTKVSFARTPDEIALAFVSASIHS